MSDIGQSAPRPLEYLPTETAGGKNWRRGYASTSGLARAVVVLLGLTILVDLASIGALQARVQLVQRVQGGAAFAGSELSTADRRVDITLGAWVVLLAATAIAFIWWFQRIYGNVAALGARDLRYGHGWSIGAWFVPILNLARPVQIAYDAWQASDPSLAPEVGRGWRAGSRSAVVGGWWAAFLISGVVDRLAARQPTRTADDLVGADHLLMASDLVDVLAAAVAILFVLRLTSRQQARADRLASDLG